MTDHIFRPTVYYNVLGTAEPVLTIAPGDTVQTITVDAHGYDADRMQVAASGNPMTGPFFIEGAEPGDTLVVHIEELVPNRGYGWSRLMLAPNVVDPDFVPHLPWPADGQRRLGAWHVDVAAGTATLVDPEVAGGLVVPLAPMLGCFGVAADEGQAISTATSSTNGGNMDYRGFGPGVTVYFPVFVPGALFYLGDVHAVQGAGEIAGTGVEISCNVRFRVDMQKGRRINWPRGETATHILTAGNARPLDQALQHATTEMARWLQEEYGLHPTHAQTLLGQVVDYEVGNVFDPAYTMICKLDKRWLPQLPQ